jgi:demethylmenaquinone methyltransferase/2-methoxy-6-polyprenyl-1,4-benzoquinol methylase
VIRTVEPAPGRDALPAPDEKRATVEAMFDRIAGRYERVNRLISLGQDRRWRRRTLDALAAPAGAVVLDLACGTGDLCRALAAAGHTAVGVDLSAGMLEAAGRAGPLVRADVLVLPVRDAGVDAVTCGFALRNLTALGPFLDECARVVRRGGRVALLDAAEPAGALARWGHDVWFRRVVPRIGALLSDAAAYRYLPASTAYLPPPDALARAVATAGFGDVARVTMTGGAVQLITGTRR